jgi:predicted MFS family arabinose efflux permease
VKGNGSPRRGAPPLVPSSSSLSSAQPADDAPRFALIVPALGIAQIISWGSLFYAITVLASPMQRSLDLSRTWVFGAFTLALLVSGGASPAVGRLVDKHGGRKVLAWGSVTGAAALAVLSLSANAVTFACGWILAGFAMAATLYEPAFATLHRLSRAHYRRTVTALTLVAGFSSTIFWPLTSWLDGLVGWRGTLGVFSVLQIVICLPLHAFVVPRHTESRDQERLTPEAQTEASAPATFHWLASAFSIAMFVVALFLAHLIEILGAHGVSASDAILVGVLVGPMQVAARIVEFGFSGRVRARSVGIVSFSLLTVSMAGLAFAGQSLGAALLCAGLFGASNGIFTIVRGTVPVELLGPQQVGALLGRLARPAFVAKAIAPLAFAAVLAFGLPVGQAVEGLAVLALLGLGCFMMAIRLRAPPGRATGDL